MAPSLRSHFGWQPMPLEETKFLGIKNYCFWCKRRKKRIEKEEERRKAEEKVEELRRSLRPIDSNGDPTRLNVLIRREGERSFVSEEVDQLPSKRRACWCGGEDEEVTSKGIGFGNKKRKQEEVDLEKKKGKVSQVNEESTRKIYVKGLPLFYNKDDIRRVFESCGTITEIDCMNVFDEWFSGKAIITFETAAAAKQALQLHLTYVDRGVLSISVSLYLPAETERHRGISARNGDCNALEPVKCLIFYGFIYQIG